MLDRKLLRNFDWTFLLLVSIIVAFGVIIIMSATQAPATGNFFWVKRQILWYFVGLVAMIVTTLIDYNDFKRYWKIIYVVNIVLLLVVLSPLGAVRGGAQRWIGLGFMDIQPSEIAKIAIIITLARLLEAKEGNLNTLKDIIPAFIHIAIPVLLIMRQPDLGTAMVFFGITISMLFVAGMGTKVIVQLSAMAILAAPAMWSVLKDYQKDRLRIFMNPELDPMGKGYHVIQSKIAVGSGRIFGSGLFQGKQNQLAFLPEQHTDFIFSVVGEELGFVGGAILLFLYLLTLMRGLHLAAVAKDTYGTLLITGIIAMFAFHILVNVGMTVGVMPVTGLPLPFMSYGGSALLTNMIAVGIVLNVGMRRQKIRF
jgi:rod shape determining protein RodA